MTKKYDKSIMLHTRDLRIFDNRTIQKAYNQSRQVLHIFILNNHQLKPPHETLELNTNAIEFMHNSLIDLNRQLESKQSKLIIMNWEIKNELKNLHKQFRFEAIYLSKDYSPYAIQREKEIKDLSTELQFEIDLTDEHILLDDISKYLKPTDKTMYSVFTPMYKNCLQYDVPKPLKYEFETLIGENEIPETLKQKTKKSLEKLQKLYIPNQDLLVKWWRKEVLEILSKISKYDYLWLRNYPSLSKTTHLSAHHKFGIISMRESYYLLSWIFREFKDWVLRELFWHDFFVLIAKHYPRVFEWAFQEKYNSINWFDNYKDEKFIKWCRGETGYPIVDAWMRELNQTWYMHNRVRMIVSSFLTKHLQIHWMLWERYFASKLTDYDSCVNNWSWQWASSTWCDAQPYFRIFNPWFQQLKFDKNCEYIKKWIPELSQLEPKTIHNLETQYPSDLKYPKQIVNHKEAREKALKLFKIN